MIQISNHKQPITVYPVTVIRDNTIYPGGVKFSTIKQITATLIDNLQSYNIDDLSEYVVLFRNDTPTEMLWHYIELGVAGIILRHNICLELNDSIACPVIMYCDELSWYSLTEMTFKVVTITNDLSAFQLVPLASYDLIIDKNDLSPELLANIQGVNEAVKGLLHEYISPYTPARFSIYLMSDTMFNENYLFLKTDHAYKQSFLCIHYYGGTDINSYPALSHELSHIYLYSKKRSVFIFKEGVPCLVSNILYGIASSHNYIKSADYGSLTIWDLLQDLDMNSNEDNYYNFALDYLHWMYEKYGLQIVMECYYNLEYSLSHSQIGDRYKQITGSTVENDASEWLKKRVSI